MNSPLKQNTTTIQNLIDTINALPEAGTDLPELTNEGSASDLLSGKQLIDQDGNILTGTIATKTASNLTASGATVTVPAGYYASQATKSVATATQATPAITINASGLITATATQTAGYVAAGTKTGTKQLTTQAAKTITPSTSSQTAVASGVYTTGAVTVAAVPTQTKSVTPTSSSQDVTADSGKFLSKVTVSGDENLSAENIKSGVSIFGVTGSCEASGGNAGGQIASGTFTSDGTQNTLTITGLSFKPSNVIVEARKSVSYLYGYPNAYIVAKGDNLSSYAWHKYNSGSSYGLYNANSVTVNFLDDGFELTITGRFGQTTYYWTAIGG